MIVLFVTLVPLIKHMIEDKLKESEGINFIV